MAEDDDLGGVFPDCGFLTPEEVAELNEEEDALAAFLDERGVEYTVDTAGEGVRWVEVDWDDDAVLEVVGEFYSERYPDSCDELVVDG